MFNKKLVFFSCLSILVGNGVGAAENDTVDLVFQANVMADTCSLVGGETEVSHDVGDISMAEFRTLTGNNEKKIQIDKDMVFNCSGGGSANFSVEPTNRKEMCSFWPAYADEFPCSEGNDSFVFAPRLSWLDSNGTEKRKVMSDTIYGKTQDVKVDDDNKAIITLAEVSYKVAVGKTPAPGKATVSYILKVWSD